MTLAVGFGDSPKSKFDRIRIDELQAQLDSPEVFGQAVQKGQQSSDVV